jgi:sulfur-oxidizing protein SoxB
MLSRRDFVQVAAAAAALLPAARGLAQQRLTQDELLRFNAVGTVTLLHITDVHGQLVPVFYR